MNEPNTTDEAAPAPNTAAYAPLKVAAGAQTTSKRRGAKRKVEHVATVWREEAQDWRVEADRKAEQMKNHLCCSRSLQQDVCGTQFRYQNLRMKTFNSRLIEERALDYVRQVHGRFKKEKKSLQGVFPSGREGRMMMMMMMQLVKVELDWIN